MISTVGAVYYRTHEAHARASVRGNIRERFSPSNRNTTELRVITLGMTDYFNVFSQ